MTSNLVQKMMRKYYPAQKEQFRLRLKELIPVCEIALDAGCGDGRIFKYEHKEQLNMLVGVDLREDLADNQQIHFGVQADVGNLPFRNNTFDLIFSRFLLEHIKEPEPVFLEFARILRPGGRLLIIVPNAFHYFSLAGRIIPHSWQQRFAGLVGYQAEDTFPTYYRANTGGKLRKLAKRSGLEPQELIYQEVCNWFLTFSAITFAPAIFYERLVNRYAILGPIRCHIIAEFSKP